tara:strand:+ start:845 stop:1360 length:516 start_codon:yes stop_codon:yes gene_type:complete
MKTLFWITVFVVVAILGRGTSTFGQSIVVSSGGGSVVQSSNADRTKPVKLPTPKIVVIANPEQVKAVPTPQPVQTRPVAIQPQPVVARTSSELAAEQHLRTTHGIAVSGMSMREMEAIHDEAHGGNPDSYRFPGMASLNTTQPVRYQKSNNCPNGRCPTVRTRSVFQFRRR